MTGYGSRFRETFARHSTLYAVSGFAAGVLLGSRYSFMAPLERAMDAVVSAYGTIAPVIIFLILAPSLLRMAKENGQDGVLFSIFTLYWFARVRVIACLLGILLVAAAYGLPLVAGGSRASTFVDALSSLGAMLAANPSFHAIYASIAVTVLLRKSEHELVHRFIELPRLVETLGELITLIVPMFTMLVGIYVTTLPEVLAEHFAEHAAEVALHPVTFFGIDFEASNADGILALYVVVSLLTGLVCTLWHACLLLYTKSRARRFSFSKYVRSYFIKVYSLSWATSSEALTTPLNTHLIKETYPDVDPTVRRLAVGLGSVINVNGTLICCFVMIPCVCLLLGIPISVMGLMLCFPVIYVLGFGVPGIPGELVLFAGPIMGALAVPEAMQPAFLWLFLGMQVGLPDSFRTGANSTDAGPATLLLDAAYRRQRPAPHVPGE